MNTKKARWFFLKKDKSSLFVCIKKIKQGILRVSKKYRKTGEQEIEKQRHKKRNSL